MKITTEVFDFSKYEYASEPDGRDGWEFLEAGGSWVSAGPLCAGASLLSIPPPVSVYRRPKAPPMFVLLNPGDRLQDDDQRLLRTHPSVWGEPLQGVPPEAAPAGSAEIWRRPVGDLVQENKRLQMEVESLEREVVELQQQLKLTRTHPRRNAYGEEE